MYFNIIQIDKIQFGDVGINLNAHIKFLTGRQRLAIDLPFSTVYKVGGIHGFYLTGYTHLNQILMLSRTAHSLNFHTTPACFRHGLLLPFNH